MVPHYGVFSRFYFQRYAKIATKLADKYAGFKKSSGPPYWSYDPRYPELEHNEYLNSHNIDPEETKYKGDKRSIPVLSHHAHH